MHGGFFAGQRSYFLKVVFFYAAFVHDYTQEASLRHHHLLRPNETSALRLQKNHLKLLFIPNISLEPISGFPGKPSRSEKAWSFAERQEFRS
jgi:hypothetical protein